MIIASEDDKDHDGILEIVIERARLKNVKFNESKIQFRVPQIHSMGSGETADGLRPHESSSCYSTMPSPDRKLALGRFLGLVKYLVQYIPHESGITQPLRSLLKEDFQWQWIREHEAALRMIREVLTSQPLLRFYDVKKPVTIQTDTSSSRLGACLLQENHSVVYASKTLTSTEKNYSQVEKEILAICFAVVNGRPYIYANSVRPLSSRSSFQEPLSQSSTKTSTYASPASKVFPFSGSSQTLCHESIQN